MYYLPDEYQDRNIANNVIKSKSLYYSILEELRQKIQK